MSAKRELNRLASAFCRFFEPMWFWPRELRQQRIYRCQSHFLTLYLPEGTNLPVHKTAKCGFMSGFTKGRKIVKIADEQVLKSDPLVLRTAQKGAE